MNRETLRALNRINRSFYDAWTADFDASRALPWRGWRRVLEVWQQARRRWGPEASSAAVLDVGCGNGRFGRFLCQHLEGPFSYWGVDSSLGLLAAARSNVTGPGPRRFLHFDVVEEGLAPLAAETFSLIALFGVLHHVPSFSRRSALLRELVGFLAPGGILALSLWQFATVERLRRRTVPWAEYNRRTHRPIDLEQIEPGDVFLRWGEAPQDPGAAVPGRYCHFIDADEARRLLADLGAAPPPLGCREGTGIEEVESFRADGASGDLNLYLLLQRHASAGDLRRTRGRP